MGEMSGSSQRPAESPPVAIAPGPTVQQFSRSDVTGASELVEGIFVIFSYILIVLTMPFSFSVCIKIVQEYERAVIFRLGRLIPVVKGPGLFFIVPCVDNFIKLDLRVVSYNVPTQEILSRDSVTVSVDAVVYFKISDPITSVVAVENATESTKLLAQTTLRTILGTHTLSEVLSEREEISANMKIALDEATGPWGVKVERVELRDVRLPPQMQRAMAAEAEATREAGAKIIAAEGEMKASASLAKAAEVINQSEGAMQLRYLQTLNTISSEKTSTIVFPFPMELLGGLRNTVKVNPQPSFFAT
ncbi:unnamed protein product [Caenorhabditis auriculariae]|uniref:Band 7 domain-containing protein n=1 Tax=Caenorhabditis auriculariae TaxID=2777116 RepID=A0A8S1H313_9PELO|nr:unnamed protein product [Caenorhabditis auriculariae]